MDQKQIQDRLLKLEEEQQQRQKQVQEWQDQINRLNGAIAQTKEAHDFVRGQIAALQDVLNLEAPEVKVVAPEAKVEAAEVSAAVPSVQQA